MPRTPDYRKGDKKSALGRKKDSVEKLSWHECMERGMTRLGKIASDKRPCREQVTALGETLSDRAGKDNCVLAPTDSPTSACSSAEE